MLYRNCDMHVEESIKVVSAGRGRLPWAGDKTNPMSIMGACSADIPTIVVTGGLMLNGHWRGKGACSCSTAGTTTRSCAPPHHRARVRRDRGRDVALQRSLHDDGDRVDDGAPDRGARADAAGAGWRSLPTTRAARMRPRPPDARSSSSSSAASGRRTSSRATHSRTRSARCTGDRGPPTRSIHT